MASSHGTPPVFNNKVIAWIDHRLPVFSLEKETHLPDAPNFNYFWNFGAIATVMLVLMIATGVVLATNYTPHVLMAFDSVERIDRDVPQGWLIRDLHMNGASFFFIAVYIHIFRGMYYGSYKAPRELLWILGVIIFLLMMATAFMGYVLPWGQMSFWGATVITNLFSAIPVVGESITTWLWAASPSTIRRSTASTPCTTCCPSSSWRWRCTSLRCTCTARTIRSASIRAGRRTPCRSIPTTR